MDNEPKPPIVNSSIVNPPPSISTWVMFRNGFIAFWNFLENRNIIRRGLVIMTIYITLTSYDEAWDVVRKSLTIDNINVAAMIGAILTPLSALQGFVIKWYFTEGSGPENQNQIRRREDANKYS